MAETAESAFARSSALQDGALIELTPDGGSPSLFITDQKDLAKGDGWTAKVLSEDPSWHPDRCSSLRVARSEDSLVWFETTVEAPAAVEGTFEQYQLVGFVSAGEKSRFVSITPTPATSVALVRTLMKLSSGSVAYAWAAKPGLNAITGAAPVVAAGAAAPEVQAPPAFPSIGSEKLYLRTINPKDWTFTDTVLPHDPSLFNEAYALNNKLVLQGVGGTVVIDPTAPDETPGKTIPTRKALAEELSEALPAELTDPVVITEGTQATLLRAQDLSGALSYGYVADKKWTPAPKANGLCSIQLTP